MAFLYQVRADGSVAQHWALGQKPLVVGRGDHADACVEDGTLSGSHFLILNQGAEFFAMDLRSSNGTSVNGNRILSHKLQLGEVIQAGQSRFCFTDYSPSTFASLSVLASMTTRSTAQVVQAT
jgi:pSer/pThr/pTyr-binding forkhead associated (FHA) protein